MDKFKKLSKIADASGDVVNAQIKGKEIGTDEHGNKIVETVNENGDVETVKIDHNGAVVDSYDEEGEYVEDFPDPWKGKSTEEIEKALKEEFGSNISDSNYSMKKDRGKFVASVGDKVIAVATTESACRKRAEKWVKEHEVKDSIDSDQAAEFAVGVDQVYDLYTEGTTSVSIPSGINTDDYIKSVLALFKSTYKETIGSAPAIETQISGNMLNLYLK